MTWKTTFTQDSDKIGVGSVVSIFTYDDNSTFVFSGRIEGDDAALGKFAQSAQDAKKKHDDQLQQSIPYAQKLDSILNGK